MSLSILRRKVIRENRCNEYCWIANIVFSNLSIDIKPQNYAGKENYYKISGYYSFLLLLYSDRVILSKIYLEIIRSVMFIL